MQRKELTDVVNDSCYKLSNSVVVGISNETPQMAPSGALYDPPLDPAFVRCVYRFTSG